MFALGYNVREMVRRLSDFGKAPAYFKRKFV